MKRASLVLSISLMLCFFAVAASADTITWISGISGDWSNPTNWSPNQVPGTSDTAIITASGNYIVTLDETAYVEGLILGTNDGTTQTFQLNGQTLNVIQQVTVNPGGMIDLSSGTLNGYSFSGGATINGILTCSGGALTGDLTFSSNSVLNLYGPSNLFNGLSFLTNYGTVNWSNVDLQCQSSPRISNYGLWAAETNNTFYGGNGGGTTTFNNYGIFRKTGGAFVGSGNDYTMLDQNTVFNNYGMVDNQFGLLLIDSGNSSSGSMINTVSNSFSGLGLTLSGDVYFTGAGDINGNLNGSNAVLHGVMTTTYITLAGTLTLATNSVLCFSPLFSQPISFDGTTFTNYGTVVWTNNDLYGNSSPQIYNYGLWDAQSDNTFYGAASYFTGPASGFTTFNNYGVFRKSGGNPFMPPYETTLDGNTRFNNSGLTDIQTGNLGLEGSNSLIGGTLNFGITSPANFGEIFFDNNALLNGSLSVNLNNYSPTPGDSFPLIDYFSVTGMFTSLNLPHLPPALAWQISYAGYGGSALLLSVVSASPPQLSTTLNVSSNSISLAWCGLWGQLYQVQCTTNLAPADWVNLGNPMSGTNGTITVSDGFGAGPQKFYRIELQ